jgi:hypothetical protein
MRSLAAMLTGALLAASCGNAGGAPGAGASRCEEVSAELTDAIAKGLIVPGGGTLRGVQAVKSTIPGRGWYVTADLEGPSFGAKDDLATWTTTDLSGTAKIFAAGAFAREYSEWESLEGFEHSDDGYAESRACVTDKLR